MKRKKSVAKLRKMMVSSRKGSDNYNFFLGWAIKGCQLDTNLIHTHNIWSGQTLRALVMAYILNLPESSPFPIVLHSVAQTCMTCLAPESICAEVHRINWCPLKSLPDLWFYKQKVWCFSYLDNMEREKGLGWVLLSCSLQCGKGNGTSQPKMVLSWDTLLGFIKQDILGSEWLKLKCLVT